MKGFTITMNIIAGCLSELPSSTHAVVSNDDLLIEILLRLPFLSLHLFKSVSKRWLSLITDPTFTLRRTQNPTLDPPSGLFLPRQDSFKYDFLTLDARISANRSSPLRANSALDFNSGEFQILQSCNGLILCRSIKSTMFYVCNPLTNRFKMIPGLVMFPVHVRMAFDPSKSPHYKIVYAGEYDKYEIQIYSSETCNWSVYDGQFPFEDYRGFNYGIYWNGAIHWVDSLNKSLHFKLDVENPNVRRIPTPRTLDGATHYYKKLFESRGCLLLLCTEDVHSMKLSIFEMRKWSSGWLMKCIVNLDDIMMQVPKTWRQPPTPKWYLLTVGCIVIEENEEESFILMDIYGKMVQYKFVSKTIYKLYDLKSIHSKVSFEFMASLADV